MNKTTAPKRAHSPKGEQTKPATPVSSQSNDPKGQFFAAAMSMSWQLAIVVLVPIIGGFELDQRLNMLPLLTIVGFALAMLGMSAVVWRQMQLFSPSQTNSKDKHA